MNYPEVKKEYKHSSHLVYSCQYHIVFCPKYRRKVLTEEIAKRAKELFTQIAEENGFDILDMEIMSDHVHILIDCNPRFGVEHVVKLLKGKSSRILRDEFPELKRKLPTLWTRAAFISSVGAVSLFCYLLRSFCCTFCFFLCFLHLCFLFIFRQHSFY